MEPRIITISEKKLVGKRIRMSLSANLTAELWQSFMPGRKEIRNKKNADLFSIEVYDQNFDFKDCPLLCRCDSFNTVLFNMQKKVDHVNFL